MERTSSTNNNETKNIKRSSFFFLIFQLSSYYKVKGTNTIIITYPRINSCTKNYTNGAHKQYLYADGQYKTNYQCRGIYQNDNEVGSRWKILDILSYWVSRPMI